MARTIVSVGVCVLGAGAFALSAQAGDVVFSNQFEPGAIRLSPDQVYVRAGSTTTGIAGPLLLQLDAPVTANTFVPIVSLNPAKLSIDGGGVMVPQGQDSAVVTMTGIAGDPNPVWVRTNSGNHVYASVRVFDDAEPRQVVSLQPNAFRIAPGGQRSLIATLNLPAAAAGTPIDLAVSPLGAGSFTTPVTVAANGFSQSLVYTDNDISEFATLSASVAMTTAAEASIVQSPVGKLVINEIDYDQPGTDAGEFVEIHNRSPDTVSLSGLRLVLVNGGTTPSPSYLDIDLSDAAAQLAPNAYLVVADAGVVVPNGTPFVTLPVGDTLQNGAPDGVAIVDAEATAVIDAFSYAGSVTQADLPGFPAPVSLVEGSVFSPNFPDSDTFRVAMARSPNGIDNDNASSDFVLTNKPTPGECNRPYPTEHLVINEVDYDQVGADANEFVEIYNGTCAPVPLANYKLALINGGVANPPSYRVFNLVAAGESLAPGQYLVVRSSTLAVPPGVLTLDFASSQDNIQNGAPDGVALIDTAGPTLVDGLSYGGYITNATVAGVPGTFNLVEGSVLSLWRQDSNTVVRSLARSPNGDDTDNADSDWVSSRDVTPGAANLPSDNETDDLREFDYCALLSPASITVAAGVATPLIEVAAYEVDVTEPDGPAPGVVAAIGYGTGSPLFPAQSWTFVPASFSTQVGYNDQYTASLTLPAPGTYAYSARVSRDGGAHWTYCDRNGAGSGSSDLIFEPTQLGTLTVTP